MPNWTNKSNFLYEGGSKNPSIYRLGRGNVLLKESFSLSRNVICLVHDGLAEFSTNCSKGVIASGEMLIVRAGYCDRIQVDPTHSGFKASLFCIPEHWLSAMCRGLRIPKNYRSDVEQILCMEQDDFLIEWTGSVIQLSNTVTQRQHGLVDLKCRILIRHLMKDQSVRLLLSSGLLQAERLTGLAIEHNGDGHKHFVSGPSGQMIGKRDPGFSKRG